MNLPLLYVVLPLAFLLFIFAVAFTCRLRTTSTAEFAVIWGGLYGKPQIYVWCVTYVLSSLGGVLTFYLYVACANETDVFPVWLFSTVNVSYIVYSCFVESRNVAVVLTCLIVNCVVYLMLFVYTVAAFLSIPLPEDDNRVSWISLLIVTDFCNAVAVFHVGVMDLWIWFVEWEKKVSEVEVHDLREI
jgi:hypothetical protein